MGNKAMVKLVVFTEAFFFLSLIIAFIYMDLKMHFEPYQFEKPDIKLTAVFTVFLVASSFTLWIAEKTYSGKKPYRVRYWLGVTILFGLIFLIGQANEYRQLINKDITLGGSRFGSAFYTLTGFHGLHVFIGLFILSIVLSMEMLGDFMDRKSNVLGSVSIYWHFVDIVWLFVFSVVYILPRFIENVSI